MTTPELPFTDARVPGVLIQLTALAARMTELEDRVAEAIPPNGSALAYAPQPAPRWWALDGDARAEAVRRLSNWYERVLVPGYGHLTARVQPCWPQHDLALYAVDIASELHSFLYLRARRSARILQSQAEYQARLLPALLDQMAIETARCTHDKKGASQ